MSTFAPTKSKIHYPDSDGQPMAENTKQAECIATLHGNLDDLFRDRDNVFVAMDNLWYPVEGRPDIRCAPDVYVVFDRPKGHRGSYKQWVENGIPLHVVFEVLSPGNRFQELQRKYEFYRAHGVEEYYLYDPELNDWSGYCRTGDRLEDIADIARWKSPRLGIGFDVNADGMRIIRPDGRPCLTYLELAEAARSAEATSAATLARADRLADKLRSLGVDPDA